MNKPKNKSLIIEVKHTKTKGAKLPNKPSALIRLAIADLTAVEKMKNREVNMGEWHLPTLDYSNNLLCKVCFAGAVMDRTMKVAENTLTQPSAFSRKDEGKFYALDAFRNGSIREAFDCLGLKWPKNLEALNDKWAGAGPPSYNATTRGRDFKRSMRALARDLEKAGY